MLLPFKQLWTWARAILNNEQGVDYNHPPTTELFVWRSSQNASGTSKPSGHSGPSSSLNASINGRSPIKRPSGADLYPQKRSASLRSTGSSDIQVVSQAHSGANEIEILSGTPRSLPKSPCPSSLMRNVLLATRHQFLAFPSEPAPLGPKNPVLESIPMEIFLHEANIPDDDRATRLCLELNGIYKWTYFRSSSELQLIDIRFTPGAACSLCEGVPRLIARYGNISASGPNAHKDDKEDMLDE
ncbi:hypothetical protein PTTG_10259 [Puccinia triticina 1-1 BBBD Race 1]|uniref:Uncharacterized protein n=1 Tax=Puccinia triticina (isolate 1-1 / race 1 (BBBD)) TaxID=630390 RepID=A0A0C4FAL6_PUCT1|nr:hypothetical protein PTTG_10259 [Puccinia triticina 1-1 BBBD Race 1]